MPNDYDTLFQAADRWAAQTGRRVDRIVLVLDDATKIPLPRPRPVVTPSPAPTAGPRHSPDFRSVFVGGEFYTLSPTQAAVVKALWEAHDNGTPDVGQETVLEAASSETGRLRDLFRDHPAWGTLIVPGAARGTFRLALD